VARIRTIKPEFWTDEAIVQLPFSARLLFIGLWNFADDTGALELSPDRLKMQIFPSDSDIDVSDLIDLLAAVELLEYWANGDGRLLVVVANWLKHQKIDNPSKRLLRSEGSRKLAIPISARLAVAKKYGCAPGERVDVHCYYCGFPGQVHWWRGQDGTPRRWISLSNLEFDHFVSEHAGGEMTQENIVLACRHCNRSKHNKEPLDFFHDKNPSIVLDSPSEGSPLEGKGKERNNTTDDQERSSRPRGWPKNWTAAMELHFEQLKAIYPSRGGANQPWARARKAINARLREDHTWEQILEGARRYATFCEVTGKVETETVMQAATFCGPDTMGFTELWTIPKKPLSLEQANRICVRQVKTRRTAETDDEFIERMRQFA